MLYKGYSKITGFGACLKQPETPNFTPFGASLEIMTLRLLCQVQTRTCSGNMRFVNSIWISCRLCYRFRVWVHSALNKDPGFDRFGLNFM